MLSDDPADLFCQLYDALSDPALAHDRAWRQNPHLEALSAEVRADADTLELRPRSLTRRLTQIGQRTGEADAARWAAARGLDQALMTCHPMLGAPAGRWARSPLERCIRKRYTRSGRFDTGAIPGALLPKFAESGRRGEETLNRSQAFAAVHRVPAAACDSSDVDYGRIRSQDQPVTQLRAGRQGVVVACAPMLESLKELDLRPKDDDGAHFFIGEPRATEAMKGRIRAVLRGMDESGAMLGICPELALSEPLLAEWIDAVREPGRRSTSALEWIFLGSGPFGGSDDSAPYNRGVILHRKSARVVHSQDKLFPFTLMPDQIAEWGLEHLFKTRVDERMTRGKKLLIRETAWGRLAVLICEDLGKLLEQKVGRLVADYGVSLLIAPVFSKEVKEFYWEHQAARAYADQLGTATMVANSLVVPRTIGERNDVGTCLVNTPGSFKVGKSQRADQISVFWLTRKAVEVPSTHPVSTDRR